MNNNSQLLSVEKFIIISSYCIIVKAISNNVEHSKSLLKLFIYIGSYWKYYTQININYRDEISQVDEAIYKQELYQSNNI